MIKSFIFFFLDYVDGGDCDDIIFDEKYNLMDLDDLLLIDIDIMEDIFILMFVNKYYLG